MSMEPTRYKNGDECVDNCLFCQENFEESQKLGSWITCGNCGVAFRIQLKETKPTIKPKEAPEE